MILILLALIMSAIADPDYYAVLIGNSFGRSSTNYYKIFTKKATEEEQCIRVGTREFCSRGMELGKLEIWKLILIVKHCPETWRKNIGGKKYQKMRHGLNGPISRILTKMAIILLKVGLR